MCTFETRWTQKMNNNIYRSGFSPFRFVFCKVYVSSTVRVYIRFFLYAIMKNAYTILFCVSVFMVSRTNKLFNKIWAWNCCSCKCDIFTQTNLRWEKAPVSFGASILLTEIKKEWKIEFSRNPTENWLKCRKCCYTAKKHFMWISWFVYFIVSVCSVESDERHLTHYTLVKGLPKETFLTNATFLLLPFAWVNWCVDFGSGQLAPLFSLSRETFYFSFWDDMIEF